MANSFNTSQTTITSVNSPTLVFTASASTTLVKSIRVMHGSSTSSATLGITKSQGTRTDMNTVTLSAGVTSDLITDVLPLAAGDSLTVESTHQPTYVWVSYVENVTAVNGQSIDVLNDVDTTTVAPTPGQALVWDGSQWEPGTVASGSAAIDDLTDVNAPSPNNSDVLKWTSVPGRWEPVDWLAVMYAEFKQGTSSTVNNGAGTDSSLVLDTTTAKLKTGITEVKLTETSPGDIEFIVATDATGTTAFTAIHLDGTTTASSAEILVKPGAKLIFEDGTYKQWLKPSTSATADFTVNMPNKTGTLALESSIPTSVTDLTDVTSAGSGAIITTAERNKLTGIADGAEVNVNADWNAVSGDAQILNKPTIPSATSDLTNDSGFVTSNLSSADQTISGSTIRKINLGTSGTLIVSSGSTNNTQAMRIVGSSTIPAIEFTGTVKMDSGTMAGGSIRLEEFGGAGQSAITLKAPTYLSADVDFVLPDADGTNGQALVTDGSGNLSFTTISGGGGGSSLSSADQTLTGDRLIDTNGYNLAIELDPTATADTFTIHDGTHDLFQVNTNTTGTLFSVNDVSGLPMFQSNSDGTAALPQVLTAAPSGTATEGTMQFAIISGSCYLYVYLNGGWKRTALT